MRDCLLYRRPSIVVLASLGSFLAACGENSFVQKNLVGDTAAQNAAVVDADLVNAWGLVFGPTGNLFVSNNHSGKSTTYGADGTKQTLVVTVPGAGGQTGAPTGVVVNTTTDFTIPGGGSSQLIFAGEDGTLSAWNSTTASASILVADRSGSDAVYKGIAMASNNGANFVYATNFKQNQVDVFDASFHLTHSFTDPNVPAGYGPFGIQNIEGALYVTFAKQLGPDNEDDESGVGNGYVDVFKTDGTVDRRFASGGTLNSPWAVARAPSGFGAFGGAILIGNFGDGLINAFDPTNGDFKGLLLNTSGTSLAIDGLWGLTFGPSADSTTLYFAAGPNAEANGLLGTLTPK